LTHRAPINAVVGGIHRLNSGERRLTETFAALRRFGERRFGPNNCTGFYLTTLFWRELPSRCFPCSAGSRLVFE